MKKLNKFLYNNSSCFKLNKLSKFCLSETAPFKMNKPSQDFGDNKIGMIINIEDRPGSILELLTLISKHNLNITHIRSKPSVFSGKGTNRGDIYLDLECKEKERDILKIIEEIQDKIGHVSLNKLVNIPWFPKCLEDLNYMGDELLKAGDELTSDHPGFSDPKYRERRAIFENHSKSFKFSSNNNCPIVEYNEEETKLWQYMWDQLIPLHMKYACDEFKESLEQFIKDKVFKRESVPQMCEINDFFSKKTKMFFRPTGGLLSQREFLNSLAFNVFPSTQYLRHPSKPLYTPEPDIIHEFLGHACMFADKEFCEFSQEIGLASLGANDEEIQKLGTIYWYTVEFGLCKQNDQIKIYGGGILSSPSEILHSVTPGPQCKYLDFDLFKMAKKHVDICNIQTEYYLAPSFKTMKNLVKKYTDSINKPFNVSYNTITNTVYVDRKIGSNH